jgi:dihydroxyacetone kinase-like protein
MFDALERWLRLSAERLHDQAATLTALDQAIGDGDHGINMDRGFTAIVASLDAGVPEADDDRTRAGTTLRTAGRTLISTVGGASGPLYGTSFMKGGAAITGADPSLAPGELVLAALEAAIGGIQSLGKATTNEKTMLDALIPALEAGRAAQASGADLKSLTLAMADAAEAGRQATIPMLATKGRASYLGERSIGHQDPGATSAALLLRTLADVVAADPAS